MLLEVIAAPSVPSVVDPHSIGSDWGRCARPFREIIGTVMRIDSDEVLLSSTARPLNVEYAVLSSVWIILGRSDVAPLLLYNSRGTEFSADGHTLSGAFGKRLRRVEIDQLEAVIRLIRRDPSSRRAICFIGRADDHAQASRDFPCAASIQFFHRVSRLNVIVHMRSQSLFRCLPVRSDQFSVPASIRCLEAFL
ncbi:MAG: thymidylate synthase [Acidobacteria bacterium]|nr:thymidylate synthase [Acidobacteriota bacterium]